MSTCDGARSSAAAGRSTALVTGAGRGIGRAVAGELAARGWTVLGAVRREPTEPLPEGVETVRFDVTAPDPSVIPRRLELLVNNAGVDTDNLPLEAVPADEWRRLLETNVVGLAEVTRLCLPALRHGVEPAVCNLTSAGLGVPMPFFSVYRASKAAASALTESLAIELAPLGIRVLEVLPGPVATDMLAASATVPQAIAVEGYERLAELVATLRPATDGRAVTTSEAATAIVDAVDIARAALPGAVPLRHTCDPVGAEVVRAWQHTPDETHIAAYRSVFTTGA